MSIEPTMNWPIMEPSTRVRGKARHEGGWIIIDEPTLERVITDHEAPLIAFAGIRNPADAVAFASRYGLLQHHAGSIEGLSEADRRERFIDWQREAQKLSHLMGLYIDLTAAVNGDDDAIGSLRSVEPTLWNASEGSPKEPRFLQGIANVLQQAVNLGRAGVELHLHVAAFRHLDGPEGQSAFPHGWRYQAIAKTFLSALYQQLANLIIEGRELRYCNDESCGRIFIPANRRQQFCNNTCASRTRYHRKVLRETAKWM